MGEACRSLFSGGALGLLSCCITVCLLEGIRSQSLARYRERRLQSTTPEKLLRILAPSAAVRLSKRNLWFSGIRSEEHTSELQSHSDLVCRLLLEKKKKHK